MKTLNRIGLDSEQAASLAQQLNELLAHYQVFYQNTRGFHWNIRGDKFFELHAQFELLYNDLHLKIDELAERVLTLGHTPTHTFTDYLSSSKIAVAKGVSNWREAIESILGAFETILVLQRKLLEHSASAGDEGTNALMSDYIRAQEKTVWMYNALLS